MSEHTAENGAPQPVVIDITGGPLSPEDLAIHGKYQSDDPSADYYDPSVIPPGSPDPSPAQGAGAEEAEGRG